MLKILGIIVVIWLAFIVLGALLEFVFWVLVIGAAVFLGVAAYGAVKSRADRRALH